MNWMKNLGCKAGSLFANIWAFLMLTVFPLYAPDQYFDLGDHKFRFFLWISACCLLPALAALLAAEIAGGRRSRGGPAGVAGIRPFSIVDIAVLCYLAAVLLSFLLSGHKREVWLGAEGWYMGLRTQLLLIAAYFCLSRCWLAKRFLLVGHFFGSGLTFLIGILHRFRIDPLGMYEGISEKYYLEFLSTMGQATWFSSYVCTVLVIGVAYFFAAKKTWVRILAGIYCMLGFATVVTQNSDSAFLAMGALFLCLFCVSCRSMVWMERFLETLLLMLGSFKIVGIFQQIFAERALQLDGISVFLSQSTAMWVLLLAVSSAYMCFLMYRMRHEQKEEIRVGKKLPWIAVGALTLAIGAYMLAVWFNTTGRFDEQSSHHYLLFNYAWGNFRGFIWKFVWKVFDELPFLGKIFGVGPDGFKAYCYGNAAYRDELNSFYGAGQVLTNAHNELLNVLVCLGVAGLFAFLAIFVTAAKRYLGGFGWKAADEAVGAGALADPAAGRGRAFVNAAAAGDCDAADPLVIAGGLAALSYLAHNFFCYQQVCCTTFLFLVLAIAENRRRNAA